MDVELEERVVKKASELFLMHGIRSVTMDRIARESGISKRTLYEVFTDKDTLLLKTLEYQRKKQRKEMEELAAGSSNSFELCLKQYKRIMHALRCINRNYLPDLRRYHPKVALFFEKDKEEVMQESVRLTDAGIKEGYIRPELNSKILALLLHVQLEIFMFSSELEKNEFSYAEVFETIVMNYARGIATSKGLELLERFMQVGNETNKK